MWYLNFVSQLQFQTNPWVPKRWWQTDNIVLGRLNISRFAYITDFIRNNSNRLSNEITIEEIKCKYCPKNDQLIRHSNSNFLENKAISLKYGGVGKSGAYIFWYQLIPK